MMFWLLITTRHFSPICGRDAINPIKMPNFDPFLRPDERQKDHSFVFGDRFVVQFEGILAD